MQLFGKDLEHDVAIVAEIGVNHEGDVEKASELLRLAADAGADAVKFQTYTPERLASADDRERLERVARFAIDEAGHCRLADEADKLGVVFFSSALTEDAVPLIARLSPAVKIASGDIDFEPVIRASAATGLPVLLSTGNAELDELDKAVDWVRDEIGGADLRDHLVLMQCVSAYPAPVEDANVAAMDVLQERYGVHVGYSNHVIGPEACYAAVALGACILEVHFTDQKEGREFRDHQLSFDADDLAELVSRAPLIRVAVGHAKKTRQPSEVDALKVMRKGIVAARDLEKGTELTRDDLMFSRPATEFRSGEIGDLLGMRLDEPVNRGCVIPRKALRPA